MQLKLENVAAAWTSVEKARRCCKLAWAREFQKLLHGFIGGADEQAPQFLQERRMDGDVKIPIWNVFSELIEIYFLYASLKTTSYSVHSFPNHNTQKKLL